MMITPFVTEQYRSAVKICQKLQQAGYEALFAGGFVRDMIMGIETDGDIDIATNATPDIIVKLFKNTIPVGIQFGVVIVVENHQQFEVATYRSDHGTTDGRHPIHVTFNNAQNDALRRDFTINGIFYNPASMEIIDYVNGRRDIDDQLVRSIGEPDLRFCEDYLRMLRAIRFASRFNFMIENSTWKAICRHAEKIRAISVERIFTELNKMFSSPFPQRAFDMLDHSGFFALLLPEVEALKGVEQPAQFHPEGDVFQHTRVAMGLLGSNPSPVLAWSVLLHDIGKPLTKTKSDRIRFNNHDHVGTTMALSILRKYHASNSFIDEVSACIANHMNFMHVKKMRLSTLKKFLARSTISTELELHRIDCLASHGNCENYHFLKEQKEKIHSDLLKPCPIMRGKDLIALGFKTGPEIGKILSFIYDLQLEEEITTKEEAHKMVMQMVPLAKK